MLSRFLAWIGRHRRGAAARPYRRRARLRSHLPCVDWLETRELLSSSLPVSAGSWTQIGPTTAISANGIGTTGDIASAITAILPDPSDTSHLYIGTAGGGVFSGRLTTTPSSSASTAATTSAQWTPLTDTFPVPGAGFISAMAVDPDNSNVIYAGTGEPNYQQDGVPGSGILNQQNGLPGRGLLNS